MGTILNWIRKWWANKEEENSSKVNDSPHLPVIGDIYKGGVRDNPFEKNLFIEIIDIKGEYVQYVCLHEYPSRQRYTSPSSCSLDSLMNGSYYVYWKEEDK